MLASLGSTMFNRASSLFSTPSSRQPPRSCTYIALLLMWFACVLSHHITPVLYGSFYLSPSRFRRLSSVQSLLYSIVKVVGCTERGIARCRSYKGVIETLVESAFLYSLGLLLYVIFIAKRDIDGSVP
ncbi:hypothetical protein EDD85DRAFT_863338 [Armillaria nabsnona]|nr:hypothetical protein EDD85DRAFT_863338 [Armillaria nabsnona]